MRLVSQNEFYSAVKSLVNAYESSLVSQHDFLFEIDNLGDICYNLLNVLFSKAPIFEVHVSPLLSPSTHLVQDHVDSDTTLSNTSDTIPNDIHNKSESETIITTSEEIKIEITDISPSRLQLPFIENQDPKNSLKIPDCTSNKTWDRMYRISHRYPMYITPIISSPINNNNNNNNNDNNNNILRQKQRGASRHARVLPENEKESELMVSIRNCLTTW